MFPQVRPVSRGRRISAKLPDHFISERGLRPFFKAKWEFMFKKPPGSSAIARQGEQLFGAKVGIEG